MAKNGPEVEAINSPKPWEKQEPELVEPSSVSLGFLLRESQWAVDRRPPERRRRIAGDGGGVLERNEAWIPMC